MSLPLAADCRSRNWKAGNLYLMQLSLQPCREPALRCYIWVTTSGTSSEIRGWVLSVKTLTCVKCSVTCSVVTFLWRPSYGIVPLPVKNSSPSFLGTRWICNQANSEQPLCHGRCGYSPRCCKFLGSLCAILSLHGCPSRQMCVASRAGHLWGGKNWRFTDPFLPAVEPPQCPSWESHVSPGPAGRFLPLAAVFPWFRWAQELGQREDENCHRWSL